MVTGTVRRIKISSIVDRIIQLESKVTSLPDKIKHTDGWKASNHQATCGTWYTSGSIVEGMTEKREELQEELENETHELTLARLELDFALNTAYGLLKPSTILMIRECLVDCPGEEILRKKYGRRYRERIARSIGKLSV